MHSSDLEFCTPPCPRSISNACYECYGNHLVENANTGGRKPYKVNIHHKYWKEFTDIA